MNVPNSMLSEWNRIKVCPESAPGPARDRKRLALVRFMFKVCADYCPWDHKPILRTTRKGHFSDKDYWFPVPGDLENEYYYDIWSNIHFGYVGRAAGFSEDQLLDGANLEIPGVTGASDPADDITMKIGIRLWEQYGTDLEPHHIHGAILAHREVFMELHESEPQEYTIIIPRDHEEYGDYR